MYFYTGKKDIRHRGKRYKGIRKIGLFPIPYTLYLKPNPIAIGCNNLSRTKVYKQPFNY